MATCPRYIENIADSDYVGDSLVKINNNFANLQYALCDIKTRLDNTVQVRTFFYYGPNAATDSTSGMQNNISSRPSNTRIEDFVNNTDQLNLPTISQRNDVAYVIYQKTGFLSLQAVRAKSGYVPVTVPSILGRWTTTYGYWSTVAPERYNLFSPVLFTWRLTYNGQKYITDLGFPKMSQATTLSTQNWNKPELWNTY